MYVWKGRSSKKNLDGATAHDAGRPSLACTPDPISMNGSAPLLFQTLRELHLLARCSLLLRRLARYRTAQVQVS